MFPPPPPRPQYPGYLVCHIDCVEQCGHAVVDQAEVVGRPHAQLAAVGARQLLVTELLDHLAWTAQQTAQADNR